jgi:hypothetical protein
MKWHSAIIVIAVKNGPRSSGILMERASLRLKISKYNCIPFMEISTHQLNANKKDDFLAQQN